jgi:hypothetical protein
MLSVLSCVTPVTPSLNNNDLKPLLVVDGQITDQTGPFRVKLSNTVPVSDVYTPSPVLNANVHILDDQGNSFQLIGNSQGVYETADKYLKGISGNKYTLTITTLDDGLEYISTAVTMQEVPGIDSLYFEQVKKPRINQGIVFEDNWLNIMLDSHDATDKTKYWQYSFEETWEVNLLADAVKVSHSQQYAENFEWQFIGPTDNKKVCWVTTPSTSILLDNTTKNPVNEIKRFPIQLIGPGDSRLHIRYSILVKQYSIDADIYNYWNQLKDFNERTGGIYNRIPAPVFGNITCSDGITKALGFFSASSIKEKRIFITRSQHQVETININNGCSYFTYDLPPTQQRLYFGPDVLSGIKVYTNTIGCTDCTQYGTNVKPSYW